MRSFTTKLFFMISFFNSYSIDICFLILRLLCGLILINIWDDFNLIYGFEQINESNSLITDFYLIVFIKMFCTIYLLFGFFTRIVLILLIALELYLLFSFILVDTFSFCEIETVLMYLIIYLIIFFVGSGRFSVDQLIEKHHEKFKFNI